MSKVASLCTRIVFVTILASNAAFAQSSDDRAADREAIRTHIDSIFQAFIKKDVAALRATHADNWLGYLEGSRTVIKGIEGYMDWNQVDPKSPYGMKSYKMREFDMIFKGDAAFVCFVSDIESNTPRGPFQRALRICDFYTKDNGKWIQSGSDTALHQESPGNSWQFGRVCEEWRQTYQTGVSQDRNPGLWPDSSCLLRLRIRTGNWRQTRQQCWTRYRGLRPAPRSMAKPGLAHG
jgi:ketosteroid isomerase-like protein